MTPLPNHIRRQLPPLYAQQDAVVRVHFFNPRGTGNWWITGALPQGRLRLRATEGDPCQQERPGGWGDLQDLRQRLRRRRSQLTERDNGPLSQAVTAYRVWACTWPTRRDMFGARRSTRTRLDLRNTRDRH